MVKHTQIIDRQTNPSVGRLQKNLKLHWLKRVPKKQNLEQKINHSKPHNWSLSFSFRFPSKKSQGQQELA